MFSSWLDGLMGFGEDSLRGKEPFLSHLIKITSVVYMCTQSCLTLCNPMDCVACQAPLFMEFSRQEYWSGLPFPTPEDLPDPGIEPDYVH